MERFNESILAQCSISIPPWKRGMCSKLTIKTIDHVIDGVLIFLLLTLNIFHTFF